ncbi:MAG: PaaI family thioesterase [Parvibaculales bacterium]
MSAPPDGWQLFDMSDRLGADTPHFLAHIGPIYVREDDIGRHLGFRVMPHMCNPVGICHGGMLMSVMDTGLAFILHNALKNPHFTPSVSFNFDFLAPGKVNDWLEVEGQCTRHTKRTGFVSGLLNGPDGPVMSASGIFKITGQDVDLARRKNT